MAGSHHWFLLHENHTSVSTLSIVFLWCNFDASFGLPDPPHHQRGVYLGSKSADLNQVRPQLGALCPGTGHSSLLVSCSSSAPCGDSICLKGPREVSQEWSIWTCSITLETPVAATMLRATSLQASSALAPICASIHPVTQESRCFPLYRWAEVSKVSNLTSGLQVSS